MASKQILLDINCNSEEVYHRVKALARVERNNGFY
jgi:hypothetical protein